MTISDFPSTKRVLLTPKMHQIRPGPRWGSLQRSPDPLAGGEGISCPLPKTPPPLSAFGLAFGSSGLEPSHFLIGSDAYGTKVRLSSLSSGYSPVNYLPGLAISYHPGILSVRVTVMFRPSSGHAYIFWWNRPVRTQTMEPTIKLPCSVAGLLELLLRSALLGAK